MSSRAGHGGSPRASLSRDGSSPFSLGTAASVNAGCNLELSYGMRNNVFMHIPKALAMGNITLQVSRVGAGAWAESLGCPCQARLKCWGRGLHRRCVTESGPSSTHGCDWGSLTPQP